MTLGAIQNWIYIGRLDASIPITMKSLEDAGITGFIDGLHITSKVKNWILCAFWIVSLGCTQANDKNNNRSHDVR
jgi:hypothetical protein